MYRSRAQRLELLERLNAYDSGPHEDERRAAKESERCLALAIEARKWPTPSYYGRIVSGVCGRQLGDLG